MKIIRKKNRPLKWYLTAGAALLLGIALYKNPLDSIYNSDNHTKHIGSITQQEYRKERIKLAQKLQQEGKAQEAIKVYQELVHPDKEVASIYINLGLAYMHLKRWNTASRHMRNALEINPSLISPHLYIGRTLSKKGEHKQAAARYQKVIKMRPDSFDAHLHMAKALMQLKKYDQALKHNKIALKLNPSNVHGWLNTGHVYNKLGDMDKAIRMYRRAAKIAPNLANAHYNLGYTLRIKGELKQALASLNKAVELNPDYLNAHIARAQTYWGLGDFENALQDYRWRWGLLGKDYRKTENAMWNGTDDLHGKEILLYCEQGLGDTIQFIRYAKMMKELGATVVCKVQKPLVDLLSNCPYIDKLVTKADIQAAPLKAAIMSLPGILKTKEETIPADIPYISAAPELVDLWAKNLAHDKEFKVGLCWHVEPKRERLKCPSAFRSVPLKLFEPLAKVSGVNFYSLQKINGTDQLKNKPGNLSLKTFGEDFDESHGRFMDTAAVIQNLDLIITVDTSVAHVAAALGKPVWMLLPFSPDCRWGIGRSDTPWYPTMTLFRQTEPGNFAPVLQEVAKALSMEVNKKKTT